MSALHIDGLEAAMRPDRLYPVRTHEGYGFYAGHAVGGRQLLAAVDGRSLLVVVFDSSGELRESLSWKLASGGAVEDSLRQRFGWEPGLVRVKRFCVPLSAGSPRDPVQLAVIGEEGFAIAPIPRHWQSTIEDVESLGADREDFVVMVQGLVERGNFVLYWGNEFFLDGSGEVVGT